ncbi:serine/threonine protein phosphatase 2A 57 kDa regulatory subunit B' kappa isoform-like [Rutidosis leptorrhynchoides]|uniref:serine/threonine protein phosphatase 2A 57 kDa regulatory subunit B' kappa isoform-like n=1 Tax=Rutidosis leptorrhynchoides TaxID=125765 RepID=UPI003A9A2D30
MAVQRNSPITTPKPPAGKSMTLQVLFSLDSEGCTTKNDDKKTQSLDSKNDEMHSIIVYCTQSRLDDQEYALKRLKLTQLLSMIKTSITPISDETLKLLFKMVASNLFRPLPLPAPAGSSIISPEDDDVITTHSTAWPHIQIVYDILLRMITKQDVKSLRGDLNCESKVQNKGPPLGEQFINRNFIINLLTLFNSEDSRERDAVKNIVHRIYSKITSYRSFMRKAMTEVLLHFIYETDHRQNGIGEILEIWGSIINGFTIPLKDEHKVFLTKVLIPLHKPKIMTVYHRQLAYCVSQFVQKEAELGGVVIGKILRYWPVSNSQKEVLLIGELEEIVEYIDHRQYLNVAISLWTQITKCIKSNNSQVAERALYVWNNEQFVKVVSQDIEKVFPVLVEALEKNLKRHWSKNVQQLTQNVKLLLQELEPVLYNTCLEGIAKREFMARLKEFARRKRWERIELLAAVNKCVTP